eukprot:5994064-Amphidinium_carterae.1
MSVEVYLRIRPSGKPSKAVSVKPEALYHCAMLCGEVACGMESQELLWTVVPSRMVLLPSSWTRQCLMDRLACATTSAVPSERRRSLR